MISVASSAINIMEPLMDKIWQKIDGTHIFIQNVM